MKLSPAIVGAGRGSLKGPFIEQYLFWDSIVPNLDSAISSLEYCSLQAYSLAWLKPCFVTGLRDSQGFRCAGFRFSKLWFCQPHDGDFSFRFVGWGIL